MTRRVSTGVGGLVCLALLSACAPCGGSRLAQGGGPPSPPGLAPSTAASTRPGTGSGIGSATGSATASPGTRRPATGPRPTSEATSPHAVGGTVFVSDADNGSTVHVTPGQHIEVKLAPSGGSWHQPTS